MPIVLKQTVRNTHGFLVNRPVRTWPTGPRGLMAAAVAHGLRVRGTVVEAGPVVRWWVEVEGQPIDAAWLAELEGTASYERRRREAAAGPGRTERAREMIEQLVQAAAVACA